MGVAVFVTMKIIACVFLVFLAVAQAKLFGVTGQNAAAPEALFLIDQDDGDLDAVLSLADGGVGEALAYSGEEGLLYHWSGDSGAVNFQSIHPRTFQTVDVVLSAQFVDSIAAATEEYDDDENFLVVDTRSTWYEVSFDGTVEVLKEGVSTGTGGNGGGGGGGSGGMGSSSSGSTTVYKGLEAISKNTIAACTTSDDQLVFLDRDDFTVKSTLQMVLYDRSGALVTDDSITGCNGMSQDRDTGVQYILVRLESSSSTRVLATVDYDT